MQAKPTALRVLDIAALVLLAVSAYLALVYAPEELVMGQVQRVFYFHVATAWTGLLGFVAAGVAGVVYLVRRDEKWDVIEVAAVEISVVFFFITIVLGSIWARPIWNTWWTWDPRLTTAAVTELIYVAYFMLRQGIEDPGRRARFGAVYTILGAISAPITFFAIRLFRTIHPVVIGSGDPSAQGTFAMTAPMKLAFFFALFTFTVIFVDLFWNRIRLGRLANLVEELKLHVLQ
ncbi:MAG TPA: cytochrome c biogenesis protein CcsA [Anaerolineales bacterium]